MSEYHCMKGSLLVQEGKDEEAIEDFTKALSQDPTCYKAAYARATCYNKIGQFDKAIEDYDHAIKSDSKQH